GISLETSHSVKLSRFKLAESVQPGIGEVFTSVVVVVIRLLFAGHEIQNPVNQSLTTETRVKSSHGIPVEKVSVNVLLDIVRAVNNILSNVSVLPGLALNCLTEIVYSLRAVFDIPTDDLSITVMHSGLGQMIGHCGFLSVFFSADR